TELLLSFMKSGSDPAQHHRAVLPATNVASEAGNRAIEILDRVGAAKCAVQRVGDAETLKGESFFEPLAQRSRGAGMLALEGTREALELTASEILVGCVVGLLHGRWSSTFGRLWSWQRCT